MMLIMAALHLVVPAEPSVVTPAQLAQLTVARPLIMLLVTPVSLITPLMASSCLFSEWPR